MLNQSAEQAFNKMVILKYQLYNGLLLTLPFSSIKKNGMKLPLFAEHCRSLLQEGVSPSEIIESFLRDLDSSLTFDKQIEMLFLFVHLIERQVVLFDALELASYRETRILELHGSLADLLYRSRRGAPHKKLHQALHFYQTRTVLTSHPTQFYPETVLGVIKELIQTIKKNDPSAVEQILLQLGKTSFRNLEAPTPLSEAKALLDRTHEIFYEAFIQIETELDQALGDRKRGHSQLQLGFWPGGDRDGNPYVDVDTTLQVGENLRFCALTHYRKEIDHLRSRLTFPGIADQLDLIEGNLELYSSPEELLADIDQLYHLIEQEHQGLFLDQVKRFQLAVQTFGFHFASLDLRQDSTVHEEVVADLLQQLGKMVDLPEAGNRYLQLNVKEKVALLERLCEEKSLPPLDQLSIGKENPLARDLIGSLKVIETVQKYNGERGLHRYVISNTQGAQHLLEIYFLAQLIGYDQLPIDIVPLFETVDDLKNCEKTMRVLYNSSIYQKHLKQRNNSQTVMVGFSDGTKDGGYLTCNWEIFKAKERLSQLSCEHKIEIIFFDGRGGPPARGGGNTHKFYLALGSTLHQQEVQLTLQGQTISSRFGSLSAARFNIEQLFTAGLESQIFPMEEEKFSIEERELLDQLSNRSNREYLKLRDDPLFLSFLQEITPMRYFGALNLASRPGRRDENNKLNLRNLRAIPFVGAWSQVKLNVPGFYGLGIALEWAFREGREELVKQLYENNLFFRTLIGNAEQALAKSNTFFTKHLLKEKTYAPFVKLIHQELSRTEQFVLKVSGREKVLETDPVNRKSIELRENLILPLLVIQQYLIEQLKGSKEEKEGKKQRALKKLLLKTLPPIINASRNSA